MVWFEHHFVHPTLALVGILLWLSLMAMGLLGHRQWRSPRPTLRLLLLFLLLLAVARLYWDRDVVNRPMVVFLIDLSQSADGHQLLIDEYVGRRLKSDLRSGGQYALVGFAESPQLLQAWAETASVNFNRPVPWDRFTARRDYTDIEKAVRYALTLLPAGSGLRANPPSLVLITDGNENHGALLQTTAALRELNIHLEVVPLSMEQSREIAAERLTLPESLRLGEPLSSTLTVHNYHSAFTEATVRLRRDGRPLPGDLAVGLYPGKNTLRLPLSPDFDRPGYFVYEAELQPAARESDRFTENNKAGAVLRLEDKPHLLIVEPESGASRRLVETAWGENLSRMRQTATTTVPDSVSRLMDYDAVVLYDMHARRLPPPAQQALADYVRDFGGGLLVIGGPDSFDHGNYQRSALEQILPVRSREPRDQPGPTGLLLLLIDFSGSMAGVLDLVKRSTQQTIEALPDGVTMDVLAFDARPQAQLEGVILQPESRSKIVTAINNLKAGGGTDLWPALDAGLRRARAFLEKDKRRDLWARVIVFSDGKFDFDPGQFHRLISSYMDFKIQINCMAIGRKWEPNPLREVARMGKGRFEQFESRNDATPFFAFEDKRSPGETKSYRPRRVPEDPILVGLTTAEELPIPFTQYNRTQLKPDGHLSCYMAGEGGDSDPLLAWWHAGLGRVASFTSDAGGLWSEALVRSDLYRKLFLQTLIFTRRSARASYCKLEAQASENNQDLVRIQARMQESETGPFTARLFFSDRPGRPEQQRTLALHPVKPGLFEAFWPVREDLSGGGTGALVIKKQTPAGEQFFADGKIYLSPASTLRELMRLQANQSLLTRFTREGGGTLLSPGHPPRPFPNTRLTERQELFDPPGRYWLGGLILGLLFWDIALRSRTSTKILTQRRKGAKAQRDAVGLR